MRGACLLGFVLFINLKFLVVDVDVVALADHAVSRGPAFRCLWRVAFQPILICTLVAAAAGLDGLLTAEPPDSVTGGFYGRVGSGRSGSGGTTSATEEEIKNALKNNEGDDDGDGDDYAYAVGAAERRVLFARRLAFVATGAVVAVLALQRAFLTLPPDHVRGDAYLLSQRALKTKVECGAAAGLVVFPFLLPGLGLPLNAGDVFVLALTATLLVVVHLVLKQRELEQLVDDSFDGAAAPFYSVEEDGAAAAAAPSSTSSSSSATTSSAAAVGIAAAATDTANASAEGISLISSGRDRAWDRGRGGSGSGAV